MLFLIIYDITNDNLRNKIAETLKDYGLERIQYSAFIGSLPRFKLNSLIEDLKKLIRDTPVKEDERVRNIQIYPIPEMSKKRRVEINFSNGKLSVKKGEEPIKMQRVKIV